VGTLSGRIREFSIWRVPNYFIEPRGAYLGERVESIDRLNKVRSCAGLAIIAGTTVYYAGLSHLATTTKDKSGTSVVTIGNNTPEGNWTLGLIVSVVTAIFILPLLSLLLVAWTRRGARRATLVQLRWPYVAIAGWFAVFLAGTPFIALSQWVQTSAHHMNFAIKALCWFLALSVLIVEITWIVKVIYLSATGMFRAEDGHPLLPLIVAPIVAGTSALMMTTVGGNGLVGVPDLLGMGLTWGGTITVFVVSVWSAAILKQRYPADWPFRDGPLQR
jgi:hypothetical protein